GCVPGPCAFLRANGARWRTRRIVGGSISGRLGRARLRCSMQTLRHLTAFLLAVLLCGAATARPHSPDAPTAADDHVPLDHLPALKGGYFPLASKANGRTYHVYVRTPEGYDAAGAQTWPVVYLLDGDSLFPLLAPTHLFLGYDEKLPEAIIVGIGYGSFDPAINKRDVDFTGQAGDTAPGQGGAEQFHDFLRDQ